MAISIALAGIILAVAVLCLFFRYKDASPFGSLSASILFFILSAMLYNGGFTYETGAFTTSYTNHSYYSVTHYCDYVNGSIMFDIKVTNSSSCNVGKLSGQVTYGHEYLPTGQTPVLATVNDNTSLAFSIISLGVSLLFAVDALAYYTQRKAK